MEIIRISVLGISGMLLAFFVKETQPEYGTMITLAAGLCILGVASGKLEYLFQSLERLQGYLPMEQSFWTILIKMIGIAYIGQFASGICQDAGYSSIGNQIELFARLSILALSMPVLLALLDTISDLFL